ncbi:hypothetical protein ACWD5F_39810 [Streptomyces sp. NPDC002499]
MRIHRTTPALALTALTTLTLVLAGCGSDSGGDESSAGSVSPSTSASPTTAGPTTASPSASQSPTTRSPTTEPPTADPSQCATVSGSLGADDSGRTVCLTTGQVVRVELDGTAERPWKPLTTEGAGLEATNSGIVLQPGDASGAYKAVSTGKIRLSSTRPLCGAGSGRISCKGIQEWWVAVVVR